MPRNSPVVRRVIPIGPAFLATLDYFYREGVKAREAGLPGEPPFYLLPDIELSAAYSLLAWQRGWLGAPKPPPPAKLT